MECLKNVLDKLKGTIGESQILFYEYEHAKPLFSGNQTLSLRYYEDCSFYLILWNRFTKGSEACQREIEVIERTVKEHPKTKHRWYLRRICEHETILPPGQFDPPELLSDDSVKQDELVILMSIEICL